MFFLPVILGLFADSFVGAAAIYSRSNSSTLVQTSYGSVQGGLSEYRDDITVFKGIPYAASTAGSSRWTAPSAPDSWTGVYNATTFGPQCPQSNANVSSIFSSGSGRISEDCLSLNIWVPENASNEILPVYVWIYGGRFSAGSGDVLTYDGSGLASKGVIVVTFNYRVGAFGFLAHPDLSAESANDTSGNYGVQDMIFALEWVKSEIASFGGNPDQMTVGGQSAGSASALDMMYSPLSTSMIAGVIAESGARGPHDPMTGSAATSYRQKDAAEDFGVSFLETMNVTSIDELRNLSMDSLVAQGELSDTIFVGTVFENSSAFMEPPQWRPVLDGYVLPQTYEETLLSNAHNDVPIMTGNNKDESGATVSPGLTVETFTDSFTTLFGNLSTEFFSLYSAGNYTQADDSANDFYRDLSRVGTWQWAKEWKAGGARSNVYTYYWTHTGTDNPSSGAYHGSECWYVFNNLPYSDPDVDWTSDDYTIEDTMSDYWANFIKTGNPNGGNLTYWPANSNTTQTMWLGDSWGSSYISKSTARFSFIQDFFATQSQW